MLLSSMAEAMYWCGRYVERAQAVSRAVLSFERLRMDLPGARTLEMKALFVLLGEGVGSAAGTRAEQLRALVFEEGTSSSVLGALGAARENLRSARVVAPAELWHVLNRVYARVAAARDGSETVTLDALEDVLAAGDRFDGERSTRMLRDAAYAFLSIGIALERADMLLRTLSAVLPVLHPEGWERAFDDVRWRGLLDALGVTSMYRRRYHLSSDLTRLLFLVVVDASCPRSFASCLATISRHLALLPHGTACRDALSHAERDGAGLGHAEAHRSRLDFAAALSSLASLHQQFEVSYFPRGVPSIPKTESRSSNCLRDPFTHPEQEH